MKIYVKLNNKTREVVKSTMKILDENNKIKMLGIIVRNEKL